jgi:CRISPR-associated protein Cas1
MRLVVDDYGAYLKKKGNRLVISSGDRKEEFSADKVSQVLVLRGSAISTDAMELAAEKDIDIVCLDRRGRPFVRIYPCRLGGTTLTRRNQLEAYFTRGTTLAKSFIRAKMENMGLFLKSLAKTRKSDSLRNAGKDILKFSKAVDDLEGDIDEVRNRLLGFEGEGSKIYFAALKEVLPESVYSGFRSKRPPEDVFNAFLSYGYGILYSEVERACIISGLDPYLGFLHTDRYGKPSLVLDLIEEFRQAVVDRCMVTLAVRNQMSRECVDEGMYLNERGRRLAAEAVMSRLETKLTYRGRKVTFSDVILKQARELARFVNSEVKTYKPFVHRW